MLRVSELTSFNEFLDLERVWDQVLEKSKDNDVFSTWEWLWCWWKYFGKGRDLRILIAKENGNVVGIAPLMLSKYRFLHLGKIRKIEFIGTPHSDYNNFILLKREKECLKLFQDYFMEFHDWDMVELRDIREGSLSLNILQEVCNRQASKFRLRAAETCPYIDLSASLDVLLSRLGRNMRKNLRKRRRKLRRKYKVEVKTQRDFSSVEMAMKTFFNLHRKRWGSKGKPGAFASQSFRDFHLEVARLFDERKWLALCFLTADDDPIAAIYSFDYNQKKYGYLTGFAPEYAAYGVGNLLKMHAIEDSIKKGYSEYDLTRGSEQYKMEWATGVRKNFVARSVQRGFFPRMYSWITQSNLAQLIASKLEHLTLTQQML